MENIQEIERILINTNPKTLEDTYNKNKFAQQKLSAKSTSSFLKRSGFDIPELPLSPENKLSLIYQALLETKNEETINRFRNNLTFYNYHYSPELMIALHLIDSYFLKDIDLIKLDFNIKSTTINGVKSKRGNILVESTFGDFVVANPFKALDIKNIPPIFRQGLCHAVSSHILSMFPNLSGAYYHVPCYFEGYIDHSVVIDYEKGLVYDFANGSTLPLEYWEKYLPTSEFMIQGNEFNQIYEQVLSDSGKRITLTDIDYARRRIK